MVFAITFSKFNILILLITVLVIFISIMPAIRFQKEQKKKYKECLKLVKEKENGILNQNNGIDTVNIEKIHGEADIDKLMNKLYDIYLKFIDKLNKNNNDFEGILDGFIKEFYKNKIDIYKKKNHVEIIDNIELISYSILDYDKQKLKFRINISCFNYKLNENQVISGSNLERVEQIFLVTYIKSKRKWLINNIEKVFEKKLSI